MWGTPYFQAVPVIVTVHSKRSQIDNSSFWATAKWRKIDKLINFFFVIDIISSKPSFSRAITDLIYQNLDIAVFVIFVVSSITCWKHNSRVSKLKIVSLWLFLFFLLVTFFIDLHNKLLTLFPKWVKFSPSTFKKN